MADLYGSESEEASSFFCNLIHNSSSCTSLTSKQMPSFSSPAPSVPPPASVQENTAAAGLFFRSSPIVPDPDFRARDRASTSVMDSSSGFNFSDPCDFFPYGAKETAASTLASAGVVNSKTITSSLKRGVLEGSHASNSVDGFQVPEASRTPVNLVAHRTSKRSRAAEVHNLSEKRRRSRINEKMKALQTLIPNSNKTDKASMLDEAIEYLKQLQLQVQMLTLRSGLGFHPIYLPGSLQGMQLRHTGMHFDGGNGFLDTNREAETFSRNQDLPLQTVFNNSNQIDPSQPSAISLVPDITNSEASFCLESSIKKQIPAGMTHNQNSN